MLAGRREEAVAEASGGESRVESEPHPSTRQSSPGAVHHKPGVGLGLLGLQTSQLQAPPGSLSCRWCVGADHLSPTPL